MDAINKFFPISLQEMEEVRLMNRVDTKYLTDISTISKLLEMASGDFLVQEIDGKRIMPYDTVYYDTDNEQMFYHHQRGKKPRQKIRVREYVGSGTDPFLEIKHKNNKGRTKKKRIPIDPHKSLSEYSDFIHDLTGYESAGLAPKIENRFKRITLVNKAKTERITIDTCLEFHNFVTGIDKALPRLAIIEWKRDGMAANSALKPLLRALRIKESGFSKYAIGMAMTNPELRQNRLKVRLRLVKKIAGETSEEIQQVNVDGNKFYPSGD